MAHFVFQLESVLKHRVHVEREKQRALIQAEAILTQLRRQLQDMDMELTAVGQDMRENRLVGRLDLSFLAAHRRYTLAMQRQAIELGQRMTLQQRRIDAAREELNQAARSRKILEKLRQRKAQRWTAAQNAKELNAADEMVMQMAFEQLHAAEQP